MKTELFGKELISMNKMLMLIMVEVSGANHKQFLLLPKNNPNRLAEGFHILTVGIRSKGSNSVGNMMVL